MAKKRNLAFVIFADMILQSFEIALQTQPPLFSIKEHVNRIGTFFFFFHLFCSKIDDGSLRQRQKYPCFKIHSFCFVRNAYKKQNECITPLLNIEITLDGLARNKTTNF